MEQEGIDVVQVESRAKSVDSFVDKLERKPGQYDDPLSDITDLAGVRVIAYYLEDVERIGELIEREFNVDLENSVQPGQHLDPDRFGYLSTHFIVSLCSPRCDLGEWNSYSSMKAEIQVRTATQHAWAAIEHKLSYKVRDVPRVLRRRLYRLSALFELADEQFSAAREAAQELEKEYVTTLRAGDLDVPIDVASLEAYLAESTTVNQVLQLVRKANGSVTEPDTGDVKRLALDRRDLLTVLRRLDISTIGDLDQILRRKRRMGTVVKAIAAQLEAKDGVPDVFAEDHLTRILLVDANSVDEIKSIYAGSTEAALIEAAKGI